MENKHIYQQWLTLSKSRDTAITIACFKEVEKQYTQKHRQYHTLVHVADLFTHIKNADLSDVETMILAHVALFHDVIYDSSSKENERKSAQCAKRWLEELQIPISLREQIETIILATAHHTSDEPLTQLFLDMDLSILGASPETYTTYCQAIRKEYKNIPLLLYKRGRKRFLQQTLAKSAIFFTKKYQELYEKQARVNMQAELDGL
ncbi:hypothetical protein [uncultured Dokdonia sp.]|uniref:HD domain-containing protein n=1 Tax=uncultured Dokdonia sp. TaxID=575653 RepID=UPI00262DFF69|nr:hypothetical protein [uncultured Dokdonia sp.]